MLNKESLGRIQKGIKILETEGAGGISTASNILGTEGAIAALIAGIRVNLGSMNSSPPDPSIDDKVALILTKNMLLQR